MGLGLDPTAGELGTVMLKYLQVGSERRSAACFSEGRAFCTDSEALRTWPTDWMHGNPSKHLESTLSTQMEAQQTAEVHDWTLHWKQRHLLCTHPISTTGRSRTYLVYLKCPENRDTCKAMMP